MNKAQLLIILIGLATMLVPAAMVLYARFKKGIELSVTTKVITMLAVLLGLNSVLWVLHSSGQIEKDLYDNMTLTLAVSAIGFAFWQFRDAQIQEARMKVQEARMENLAAVMTTRFVGFFPNNLRAINDVVAHANERLEVISDYVGYGHFSAPEEFQRYFRQLQDLAGKHRKIRMLVLTRDEAEKTYATQFTDTQFLQQLTSERSHLIRYCDTFCHGFGDEFLKKVKAHGDPIRPDELKQLRIEFDRFMFDRQLFYMKDLLERGVEIKQTRDKLPFFLWCEDGHEAVFGFLHEHSENEREVAFRTRDGSLIEHTFEVKFEALWQNAEKIELVTIQGHAEPNWLPSGLPAAPATNLGPRPTALVPQSSTPSPPAATTETQSDPSLPQSA